MVRVLNPQTKIIAKHFVFSKLTNFATGERFAYFVIPPGKTEKQCERTHIGKLFKEAVDQHGIQSAWLADEECKTLDLEKEWGVLIFERFDSPGFLNCAERIHKDCRFSILSTQVLRYFFNDPIKYNFETGESNSPVYTLAMRNMVVCLSGFSKNEKEELEKLILFMNGKVMEDLSDVTHLVSAHALTPKTALAHQKPIQVMTGPWIKKVWTENQSSLVDADDRKFIEYKMPIFYNLKVCSSQLPTEKKKKIKRMIEQAGGTWHLELVKGKTDVLVVENAGSDKFWHAVRWNIATVLPDWVTKSNETGHLVPFVNYTVPGGTQVDGDRDLATSTPAHSNLAEWNVTGCSRIVPYKSPDSRAHQETCNGASIQNPKLPQVSRATLELHPEEQRRAAGTKTQCSTQSYSDSSREDSEADSVGLFVGLTFKVVILDKNEREYVEEIIWDNGGKVVSNNPNITILPPVCGHGEMEKKGHTYTKFWVEDCHIAGSFSIPKQFYHKPLASFEKMNKIMQGVVIATSQYNCSERTYIIDVMTAMGARYEKFLAKRDVAVARATTHLVCKNKDTNKASIAQRWMQAVVNAAWVVDSFNQKRRKAEEKYSVFRIDTLDDILIHAATPESVPKVCLVGNGNRAAVSRPAKPQPSTSKSVKPGPSRDVFKTITAPPSKLPVVASSKSSNQPGDTANEYVKDDSGESSGLDSFLSQNASRNENNAPMRIEKSGTDHEKTSSSMKETPMQLLTNLLPVENEANPNTTRDAVSLNKRCSEVKSIVTTAAVKDESGGGSRTPGETSGAKSSAVSFLADLPQNPVFSLSSLDEQGKSKATKAITTLGGSVSKVSHYDTNCHALITTKLQSNEKVLSCIAFGKFILKPDYLEQSLVAGHFLPIEKKFLWNESNINEEKERDLARASYKGLKLQLEDKNKKSKDGVKFFVFDCTDEEREELKGLIAGEIVDSTLDAKYFVSTNYI